MISSYVVESLLKISENIAEVEVEEYENFNNYNVNIRMIDVNNISESSLEQLMNLCNRRDDIYFSISINNGIPIEYDSYSNFVDKIKVVESIEATKEMLLNININKKIIRNELSIYNINAFSKYIDELSISQLLSVIKEKTKNDCLMVEVLDNTLTSLYYSNLICFKNKNANFSNIIVRENSILDKRKSICNYLSTDKFDFSPKDFNFKGSLNNVIETKFNKLKILFSLICIFNISRIEENNIIYLKIDGYKSLEFSLDFDKEDMNTLLEYYNIFCWIYTEGNISDKAGIARNIISLYLINSEKLDIDETAIKAIQSNYNIYLKQNVEKYLEIKSNIIEFLFNMNQQISEVTGAITKGFINNLIAILSFFVTVTIMNSLSDNRLQNIFTLDITIISIFIIMLSFIYLWFSIYEAKKEKYRIEKIYSRLKSSYDEVLVPKDIENIFKNDKDFNEDINEINKKLKIYKRIWIITLIVILLLVGLLSRGTIYELYINLDLMLNDK